MSDQIISGFMKKEVQKMISDNQVQIDDINAQILNLQGQVSYIQTLIEAKTTLLGQFEE